MIKYRCKYVEEGKTEDNCIEVGYRTLGGLITDLLTEVANKEDTTLKFVISEEHNPDTKFTILKSDYIN